MSAPHFTRLYITPEMVLWHKNSHIFNYDFSTVSLAWFNRYPNPYSPHVLSVDILENRILPSGELYSVRLIKKTGKLPRWARPFLGKVSDTWILEMARVDPKKKTLLTYTKNLDHAKLLQVEEYTEYSSNGEVTQVSSKVKFSSGFKGFGIKDRIEQWSHSRFGENIKKSRLGMAFVMDKLKKV